MTRRDYMRDFRRAQGMSTRDMARVCRCPETLIYLLEHDDRSVTHPKIAQRIAAAYLLTPEQADGLIPENRRRNSPEYDPDRYLEDADFMYSLSDRVVDYR